MLLEYCILVMGPLVKTDCSSSTTRLGSAAVGVGVVAPMRQHVEGWKLAFMGLYGPFVIQDMEFDYAAGLNSWSLLDLAHRPQSRRCPCLSSATSMNVSAAAAAPISRGGRVM